MVKLVDTPDLGSGAARCEGSSPYTRTEASSKEEAFFIDFLLLPFATLFIFDCDFCQYESLNTDSNCIRKRKSCLS